MRLLLALLFVLFPSSLHAADIEIRPEAASPILLAIDPDISSWSGDREWLRANVLARIGDGRIQVLTTFSDGRLTELSAYWADEGYPFFELDGQRDELRVTLVRARVDGDMLRFELNFFGVFRGEDDSRRAAEVRIDTLVPPLILEERPVP